MTKLARCLSLFLILGVVLSNHLAAQNSQPWPGYPRLGFGPTIVRPWLVLKCTLSDNRTVPVGLDKEIDGFLTITGFKTGNLTDYYADVSYGAISFAGTKVVGWYAANFNGTESGPVYSTPEALAYTCETCFHLRPKLAQEHVDECRALRQLFSSI